MDDSQPRRAAARCLDECEVLFVSAAGFEEVKQYVTRTQGGPHSLFFGLGGGVRGGGEGARFPDKPFRPKRAPFLPSSFRGYCLRPGEGPREAEEGVPRTSHLRKVAW